MSGRSRRLAAEQQRTQQRRLLLGGLAAVIAVVVALVVALVAAGGDDGSGGSGAVAGERTNEVSMIEMAFVPDPVEVDLDDAKVRIVNDGAVAHSFVVPELGKGTPDLDPGQELTIDFGDQEPGTYQVICDLPGHKEAGMVTELILR